MKKTTTVRLEESILDKIESMKIGSRTQTCERAIVLYTIMVEDIGKDITDLFSEKEMDILGLVFKNIDIDIKLQLSKPIFISRINEFFKRNPVNNIESFYDKIMKLTAVQVFLLQEKIKYICVN